MKSFPPDSQPFDDHGASVFWAFAFERRPLIRIFPRALVSLQAWCSDINFEQIYLRVVLHEWQRGLGGFAGGEVQSGRWAGGPFGPLASTTGGGRGCGSNAAVAAAATAAAAEAAAASKAAAAHEAPPKPLPRRTSGAPSTYARPRISPTCRKSPAAARDSWTARTFPGGGVWSGGPGPRPRGDGAWVVAAPRHGLRRGHRDGLRPLHGKGFGSGCRLPVRSAMGPRCACCGEGGAGHRGGGACGWGGGGSSCLHRIMSF